MERIFERAGYKVRVSEPILYVDNQSRRRSGHMTHAMVEFAPGKIIDFNSNCTAMRYGGHSTFGWIEYRISEDYGETFGEIQELPYSKRCFIDGVEVISIEKAVAGNGGRIVAFALRNDATTLCQPWNTPMVIYSDDGGKTWSEPKELCPYKGRVYDAVYYNGDIYALEFCNDGSGDFCGEREEHLYRIFKSEDNGESFEELCVVPVDTMGRSYAAMLFDESGLLHIYTYNVNDERNPDHIISEDCGKSWRKPETCFLAKGIRNPQTALIDGVYVMHGRGGNVSGFVLYTSLDGINWDEGEYLETKKEYCYYSNNLVFEKGGKSRMLIQYSDSYSGPCVNVMHLWLEIEKRGGLSQ